MAFLRLVSCWLMISIVLASKSFTIDYDEGIFLKDGQPFNYVSGSIHYSRVHPDSWHDRLYKMKFAGLDAVQVYVPWNFHETEQGVFDFTGWRDVEKFVQMADDLGLLVIFRPGPYICAEWEFGGFPYWLIKENASLALRTSDPVYLKYVDAWFSQLLPKMRRFLYVNGGPIISVQVENEYGSFMVHDEVYKGFLLDTLKKYLVDDVVYFTTDGSGVSYLRGGKVNGTLSTDDFGAGSAKHGYAVLRAFNGSFNGPYVNSEYYIGWLDQWGAKHAHVDSHSAAKTLEEFFHLGGNANMYMFYGGTNFGFSSGAPGDNPFRPVPTSYDYDAALSEAGDLTYKYWLLRAVIQKYKPLPIMPTPTNSTKMAYGLLNVTLQGPLHVCAPLASELRGYPTYVNEYPLRMELMDTGYGYVLYRHQFTRDVNTSELAVPGVRDRGYVLLNNDYLGILFRDGPIGINVTAKKGDTLSILVENMGRVNYGSGITRGTKGIISNVTLANVTVTTWSMYNIKLDIEDLTRCKDQLDKTSSKFPLPFVPSAYLGVLHIDTPADTFLRLDGWTKGHVEVNSFNIGRYWPAKGPQKTLYVPAALLNAGKNIITVTELESAPCLSGFPCQVKFVDVPDINGNYTWDATQEWMSRSVHAGLELGPFEQL